MTTTRGFGRLQRQSGAALLTAMIIVALIATLASSMVWQQWRAVQVEAAERSRAQSAWILAGALDWARLILREDAKADAKTGNGDYLGEPWAVPLAEARLSTFLAADASNTDDGPDAFLSGSITDAQARFNLTNLANAGNVDPVELAVLQRLCESIGVSADIATRIANGMRDAMPVPIAAAGGAASSAQATNPPLLPRSASQLGWLGVDAEAVRALEPYVVVLPTSTHVNINTASREVIAAVIPGLDLATAERIVQARTRSPVKSAGDLIQLVPGLQTGSLNDTSFGSSFFEVRGRLRIGDMAIEQRSLVQRLPSFDVVVLQRERVSTRDATGP